MKKQLIALLCLAASALGTQLQAQSPPRFVDANQDIAQVINLIDRRLALMPEVAAWKWRAHQPIADIEREQQVLERSVADAQAIGLDSEGARRFFAVQIRLARAVQTYSFENWRARGASQLSTQIPTSRDLNTQLRPLLDALGRDLLVAVYLASTELPRVLEDQRFIASIKQLKRHGGINDEQLSELRSVLLAVHIDSATNLQIIKRVGVLRVGTTGDYAPFSSDRDGVLSGFDVQLAQALAQHWGVTVRFVPTTWATLMSDFRQHRFDIGMSGISVTPERTAQADFSTAYHIDGKTPIARCEDKFKFSSREQIDQPAVRVIVNAGGTNERFVREHIQHASVVVHNDNRTVFDEILAGRADVMITDGIEVDLQTHRHPRLCRTMQSPLTQTEKAIMLPRATELTAEVNAWLAPQVANGKMRDRMQDALIETQ